MKKSLFLILSMLVLSVVYPVQTFADTYSPEELVALFEAGGNPVGHNVYAEWAAGEEAYYANFSGTVFGMFITNQSIARARARLRRKTFKVTSFTKVQDEWMTYANYYLTGDLVGSPTPSSGTSLEDSPCNEYYEAAIKFMIDTPVVHPFSTGNGKKIIFAPGNLQYQASTGTFRFALRQVDVVGNGDTANRFCNVLYDSTVKKVDASNVPYIEHNWVPCNNRLKDKSYAGWIDAFLWGTSGYGKKAHDTLAIHFQPYDYVATPVNATYNSAGYGPSYTSASPVRTTFNPSQSIHFDTTSKLNRYFDWGYYNTIRQYKGCTHADNGVASHPSDSTMYFPNVWRTPMASELDSILNRKFSGLIDRQKYGVALGRIQYTRHAKDTVVGILLFPDDYRASEVGVARTNFVTGINVNGQTLHSIDSTTWSLMEGAGVVFLPASGYFWYEDATSKLKFNGPRAGASVDNERRDYAVVYATCTNYSASSSYVLRSNLRGGSMNVSVNNGGTKTTTSCVRLVQDYVEGY